MDADHLDIVIAQGLQPITPLCPVDQVVESVQNQLVTLSGSKGWLMANLDMRLQPRYTLLSNVALHQNIIAMLLALWLDTYGY